MRSSYPDLHRDAPLTRDSDEVDLLVRPTIDLEAANLLGRYQGCVYGVQPTAAEEVKHLSDDESCLVFALSRTRLRSALSSRTVMARFGWRSRGWEPKTRETIARLLAEVA